MATGIITHDNLKSGSWNGNQTIDSLKTNIVRSGISAAYLADTLYSGWVQIIASVEGTVKLITIIGTSKIIHMRTTGGEWSVATLVSV